MISINPLWVFRGMTPMPIVHGRANDCPLKQSGNAQHGGHKAVFTPGVTVLMSREQILEKPETGARCLWEPFPRVLPVKDCSICRAMCGSGVGIGLTKDITASLSSIIPRGQRPGKSA